MPTKLTNFVDMLLICIDMYCYMYFMSHHKNQTVKDGHRRRVLKSAD